VPISAPFMGALSCDGYPRRAEENLASRRSCPGLSYTRALAALLRHGSITHRTVRHPRKTRIWTRRWRAVIIFAVGLGAYYHGKGFKAGKSTWPRLPLHVPGVFINITTGDCEKTLDKVPEEHGMRSTKTNKQSVDDRVGHATVMHHRLGRGSTGGCCADVR
jgi:hypothetical protein